jgi:hypothetical protein
MIDASKYKRLVAKNAEKAPDTKEHFYGRLVTLLFRERYTQDDVEAINNNYLDDPTNQKYADEFRLMQHYRKTCKSRAKEMLGMEDKG